MEGTTSLRPATAEDFDQILAIEQRAHVAPWTREHFRAEVEKPYSNTLVLTDDETDTIIQGYVVYWLMFDECHVLNVVVDLPHRGLGHAKAMLRRVIALAMKKNIKRVLLDVRKTNNPAVQLYQGLGFTITQIAKGFYSNGEDAYRMVLDLDTTRVQF